MPVRRLQPQALTMARSDRFALATLLFLLALSALMQVLMGGEGDKDWLLFAARLWLGGKRLYVDVVEVNPPLILWLYGITVWLSLQVSWLKDTAALGLMGLCACLSSAGLATLLMRRHPEFKGNTRRSWEFFLLLAMLFIFLTPHAFFFDREHILLVMTFPYILRFTPSLARERLPVWQRSLVGIFAALGFCIKPHSVILFTAIQLLVVLRERSAVTLANLENAIIALGVAGYGFCIWHFTPEYLSIILPMALATYSSFSLGGGSLLALPPIVLCAGLTFADFRLNHATPYRRDIYYFLGIVAAFLVHTIISNGWDYTYYPLMTMLLFLSGWVFWEYRWLKHVQQERGLPVRQFSFGMRGCIVSLMTQGLYMTIVTLLSVNVFAIQLHCQRQPACALKDPYVRYVHDHGVASFGTISLDYPKWVHLARFSGAQWETRFNHLWMLPRLLQDGNEHVNGHEWMVRYLGQALAQDLTQRKPEIVFVDTGRQFFAYPRYEDILQFLMQVPEFKSAWSRYRYTTLIDECAARDDSLYIKAACRYEVYSRIP